MLAANHGHPDPVWVLTARRLLVEAGADPAGGAPSAVDAAAVFGPTEYLELFGGQHQSRAGGRERSD